MGQLGQTGQPADPGAPRRSRSEELLARGGPREILARIVPGDPLDVRRAVARRARERALLVDLEQASLRALALCAADAVRYRGRPELDQWLGMRVEMALDGLIAEEALRAAAPSPASGAAGAREAQGSPSAALASRVGSTFLELDQGRARFHRLPFADRDAFLRLVVEAQPLDDTARAQSTSTSELARRARRGLEALFGSPARERREKKQDPAPARDFRDSKLRRP